MFFLITNLHCLRSLEKAHSTGQNPSFMRFFTDFNVPASGPVPSVGSCVLETFEMISLFPCVYFFITIQKPGASPPVITS